jgi:hypothetical protein
MFYKTNNPKQVSIQKRDILFKIEACEKINHRYIFDIPRINPPKFGGGLIFEHNPSEIGLAFHGASADIGQNSHLWIGT